MSAYEPRHPDEKCGYAPDPLELINEERGSLSHQTNAERYDQTNSPNDYIAFAVSYLGRAATRMPRNQREGHDRLTMLIKAGALVVQAIEQEIDLRIQADTEALAELEGNE